MSFFPLDKQLKNNRSPFCVNGVLVLGITNLKFLLNALLNCCDDVLCTSVVVPEQLVVWKLSSLKTSYHLSGSCVSLSACLKFLLWCSYCLWVITDLDIGRNYTRKSKNLQ